MSTFARSRPLHGQHHVRGAYSPTAPAASSRLSHNRLASMRPVALGLAKLIALPLASAAPLTLWERNAQTFTEPEHHGAKDNGSLIVYLLVAVALVLLGGVFAGLTIALMGQDETYLQVIASSGEGSERKHATKVLNLLKKGKHWVLVTLLLSNVITNETLPIVLDRSLGGGWPAVVSSTVLIVIFGEIAPQSVCVRYGLSIGAFMAPFVLTLMWIMAPIAWPTARFLDWILGEDHGTTYKKAGLKTLVSLHKTLGTDTTDRLLEDEVTIINSVLDLKEKPVGDIMTPMQDVFTMSAETVLDEKMMDTILSQGYSRIPIHSPDNYRNFIGMLLVKILITYDPEDCKKVRDFSLATLPETAPNTSCLDIINFFQEGKSHMVLVSDCPGQDRGALGVVTLEDVIEELIGEEIIDESDVFIDVHKAIRRLAPAPKTLFHRHQLEPTLSDAEQDAKEVGEDEPLLGTTPGGGSRKPSLRKNNTTFLIRRKSSNASDATKDTNKPVTMRSNTTDIRQHLMHLGPSNAANKPRATKYAAVKIKPGVGTIPENKTTTPEGGFLNQTPPKESILSGPPDGAASQLLRTEGASDGVAALQAGYGTLSSPPHRRPQSADMMSPSEASRFARENAPNGQDRAVSPKDRTVDGTDKGDGQTDSLLKPPEKLVIGGDEDANDDDKLGEMTSLSRDRSADRRVARSGSITQTTVDSNGLKKIVLETTSSSEDHDESTSPQTSRVDGVEDEDDGEGEGGASANGNGKKKRKKRGKRKKGGND